MPHVKYTSRVAHGTVIQTRPLPISIPRAPTLRHLYPRIVLASTVCVPLRPFPPLVGPCSNLLEHPQINDPNFIDLDAACFIIWRSVLAGPVFSKRLCAGPEKTTSLFMLGIDLGVLQCRFFFFCALIAMRPVLM